MRHWYVCFLVFCTLLLIPISVSAKKKEIHIVIDAGHGGEDFGAEADYDGTTVFEKDLNLKVARFLGRNLETYEGVTVSYTRDDDRFVGLLQRTQIAKNKDADILVSIHHNAVGDIADYDHGCTVLTGRGVYKKQICEEEQKLACNILYELSDIGLEDQGILLRQSENGSTYENGELSDYYAIIRNGLEQGVPSILIEHAFVDSDSDYTEFLNSNQKIKKIAEADAKGIARYYRLKRKGEEKAEDGLTNIEEKITLITDGDSANNQVSYKTFYKQKEGVSKQKDSIKQDSGEERKVNTEETIFEKILKTIKLWIRG
ncbi:MAG: N-acetylmuramoyl-L-alanine amidase [Lachnospiraceae bacterium]|nr:N-acetylmuramoyl-L-alanine amidase [Lachnospiraceae bacterium]